MLTVTDRTVVDPPNSGQPCHGIELWEAQLAAAHAPRLAPASRYPFLPSLSYCTLSLATSGKAITAYAGLPRVRPVQATKTHIS